MGRPTTTPGIKPGLSARADKAGVSRQLQRQRELIAAGRCNVCAAIREQKKKRKCNACLAKRPMRDE